MKFHKPTKIIFTILGLLMLLAFTFVVVNFQNFKKPVNAPGQSAGVCSPNLANCQGNAELCMELNKNPVCN